MKNFVSRQWLRDNLSRDNLVILDTRAELADPKYGLEEYKKSHIKGAQFVSLEETLTGELDIHGGRHPMPDMQVFIEDMKKLGVNDESTIVIYDNGELAMAGRLWYLFKYIGKENVYILEGGFKEWKDNNLEIVAEIKKIEESGRLSINTNKSIIVDMEEVRQAIKSDKIAIVDARAYERYAGEVEPLDRVAGHIPKAINFPWMDLVEDGKLIDIEKIKKRFKTLNNYDTIITHCGSGITGTVNFLAMDEIGLNPKLYAGGYSDWISYSENKIIEK